MWTFETGMCALLAVVSSFWMCAATIRLARAADVGVDAGAGVQKFHSHWVPRLGGIPIFFAFTGALLLAAWVTGQRVVPTAFLIVCCLPAFSIGLLEDLTQKAGILTRLLFTMLAAALGWWLLKAQLVRLDIPLLDAILQNTPVLAFALTLVAAGGVAHALNIVDGYNGLSGFLALIVLGALTIVAAIVGDAFIFTSGLLLAASIVGFLLWNFPFGRIFLGDAGAYTIGLIIAELSILLVVRHPEVSAWFPMLLMAYPVWETLFSMYRRAIIRGSKVGQPDALHLHQLVYRRLMRRYVGSRDNVHALLRNSFTSIYLWVLTLLCAVPAVLFWNRPGVLMALCVLFAATYVLLYRRLVQFRAPSFLIVPPARRGARAATAPVATEPGLPI